MCDLMNKTCVDLPSCTRYRPCYEGLCIKGRCQPFCTQAADCFAGQSCKDGVCVKTSTSFSECPVGTYYDSKMQLCRNVFVLNRAYCTRIINFLLSQCCTHLDSL